MITAIPVLVAREAADKAFGGRAEQMGNGRSA